MPKPVGTFIAKVIETHASGHAREHSYRPALKELFEGITGLIVINEPKRSEYGAPDFVFLKGKVVIAYAEAKDVNVVLDDIEKSEQMDRYYGYSNIILTNGLEFRFYRNTAPYADPIVIGKLQGDTIATFESSFQLLEDTVKDFIKESKEPIKSGTVLAKVMAGKARRIRDNIKKFLADENNAKNENLLAVYEVIKKLLLADLDKAKFADMYAQTLVYGLFAARYYDEKSDDTFSRQKARDLVPASNPFLRHFFDHIAGPSFDSRIEMIVNELCEEFTHADVQAIVHNYYKVERDSSRDPIIHFYEDFLQAYDSVERKKMGVFYTPLPVVHFIVRAVDDILKKEFDLPQGLADASKIEITREEQGKKKKEQVHKVQILDPATGTGTFLNEVILHIRKTFESQEGRWSQYVNSDLLPRLHGFELMMASYTIAHLKLSSTIQESGAKIENARLGIYLTNSLEKGEEEQKTLFDIGFGKAITEESNQANKVKNELPIMVIMGNPPYAGVSSNDSEYANSLVNKYRYEPGGVLPLKERKIWLKNDYVKFIALAEDMIEKNGSGVIAMITDHSYLDGPTFRGMRWHLAKTFDKIFILDLHGNAKRQETSLNGSKDENIFDIMQGVAILLAIKTGEKKASDLAMVSHSDLYGSRISKFSALDASNITWVPLKLDKKQIFFDLKDQTGYSDYERGFLIKELFLENSLGFMTGRDAFATDLLHDELSGRIKRFYDPNTSVDEVKKVFSIKDFRKFVIKEFKERFTYQSDLINNFLARPFDNRQVYYQQYLVQEWQNRVMRHMVRGDNVALIIGRQSVAAGGPNWDVLFISKSLVDLNIFRRGGGVVFPLYCFNEDGTRTLNLRQSIVESIQEIVGKVNAEDILYYIYAFLHSPEYREKYKEFLRVDFPRVPYPTDKTQFERFVTLGRELRTLHLLESPKVNQFITTYPIDGSNMVEKIEYKDGNVYINKEQFFGNVPAIAYNFYIGGYQPAQKWLKDRKGRTLSNEDIEHYQKMIVALSETVRIMKEIDETTTF